ncbi:hypothetical protein N0V82_000485 [Gnomoniopsis sp. IMI 355080]|nr:hypothetical protein N0V82_000485 [Gnomoniopsis sp. IMI 355080]
MSSNNLKARADGAWGHQNLFVPDRSHAIRKIVKEDFRGATPAGLIANKSEFRIDLEDMMMRKALDEVRVRCQVWIDCFSDEGHLLIAARKLQYIQNGLQEVREWILAQSSELKCNATTLVHRTGDGPHFCIQLKPTQELGLGKNISDGWRGVSLLGGVKDEDTLNSIAEDGLDAVHWNNQSSNNAIITKQLLDAIELAARLMRPDVGRKYLRIHLGIRSLSKRKTKGMALNEYTTQQFRTLMRSATERGHHTYKTDNPEEPAMRRFVALDATIDRLTDVKPRFCLVFFSGNFRIEMDIHMEPSRTMSSQRAKRMNLPTASSPRVFRFNKTVDAEIVVACPDMKVDWQLSVDSDISADVVHNKFRDLAKELRFDPVLEDGQMFPIAHASRVSLRNANIDSVACRAIWTFECVEAPCRIDFTEYHDWDAHPLSKFMEQCPQVTEFHFSTTGRNCPLPNKSCAVSLYGDDWDEKLRNLSPASGKFAEQIIDLFGHGVDGKRYVDSLIQEVEFLLGITSQAAVEAESLGQPTQATTKVASAVDTAARAATEIDLIDFSE